MAKILIGNFKGPKGDTGDEGPEGVQGVQGPPGPAGESGASYEAGTFTGILSNSSSSNIKR